jgi:carboxylesterase type B
LKVTIAGESAGAMSVMALYFSKAAKGLFHQAISQSGVLNTPFLTADRDSSYHFRYFYRIETHFSVLFIVMPFISSLASHVDCDQSGSTASIIKCLKLVTLDNQSIVISLKFILKISFQKTTEEIVSVLRDKGMHSPSSTFDPISYIFVVDDFSPEPILSGDPLDLIQDGFFNDVPLMIGTNKDEGFMFVNRFVPNNLLTMTKEIWETKGSAMLLGRLIQ